MKLDLLTVKQLIRQRLPFSDAVAPKQIDYLASEVAKFVNRGEKADYIALQLSRIHANKFEQAFAGKSYVALADELVRLADTERTL